MHLHYPILVVCGRIDRKNLKGIGSPTLTKSVVLDPVWRMRSGGALRRALVASVAVLFVATLATEADAARRKADRTQAVSKTAAKKQEPFPGLPNGPLQMVVSIGSQHA